MPKPAKWPPTETLREWLSYDPETGVFTRNQPINRAGDIVRTKRPDGYLQGCVRSKAYLLHRLAFQYVTGRLPTGEIDHINGDKHDNRFANLREVSRRVNQQNWRKVSKRKKDSAYLGVSRHHSGRWYAQIGDNYKCRNLGVFDTEEEAHERYLEEKRKIHEGCTI